MRLRHSSQTFGARHQISCHWAMPCGSGVRTDGNGGYAGDKATGHLFRGIASRTRFGWSAETDHRPALPVFARCRSHRHPPPARTTAQPPTRLALDSARPGRHFSVEVFRDLSETSLAEVSLDSLAKRPHGLFRGGRFAEDLDPGCEERTQQSGGPDTDFTCHRTTTASRPHRQKISRCTGTPCMSNVHVSHGSVEKPVHRR